MITCLHPTRNASCVQVAVPITVHITVSLQWVLCEVSLDWCIRFVLAKLTDAVVGMQGSVASMAATVANMASQQSVLLEMMMRCIGGSTSVGRESKTQENVDAQNNLGTCHIYSFYFSFYSHPTTFSKAAGLKVQAKRGVQLQRSQRWQYKQRL